MVRKRYSDEDCLMVLREIELQLAAGSDVPTACRSAGISEAIYYAWRKKCGGIAETRRWSAFPHKLPADNHEAD